MSAKSKTLIGALAVLILLAGFYFIAGALSGKKTNTAQPPFSSPGAVPLADFDPLQITKIEVMNAGLVLEKSGDVWQLVPPPVKGIIIDQAAVYRRLWSMANLYAERIVEDAAGDLSQYGLDVPIAHAAITDSSGKRVELFFGNLTPDRTAFYTMLKDDPKIYTVYSWAVVDIVIMLNDIRDKRLLPDFDPDSLSRFILENAGNRIEIEASGTNENLVSTFSSFVVTSPYRFPRWAAVEKIGDIQRFLAGLSIEEFIDDEPASLVPYGLDKPGRMYVESPDHTMNLYYGYGADGRVYARLADGQGVFTVSNFDKFVNIRAFDIIDKYITIFNINRVNDFSVVGEGRSLLAAIRGTAEAPEFFLNGRRTEDMAFRTYYQSVISLVVEAEHPGLRGGTTGGNSSGESGITITFNLREPAGRSASVSLIPYNRDFYSVSQGGVTEFLVSRSRVRAIFDFADTMEYEE